MRSGATARQLAGHSEQPHSRSLLFPSPNSPLLLFSLEVTSLSLPFLTFLLRLLSLLLFIFPLSALAPLFLSSLFPSSPIPYFTPLSILYPPHNAPSSCPLFLSLSFPFSFYTHTFFTFPSSSSLPPLSPLPSTLLISPFLPLFAFFSRLFLLSLLPSPPFSLSHQRFSLPLFFPSPLTPSPPRLLRVSAGHRGVREGGKKQRSLLLYPTPLPLSLSFLLLMWETPCQAPHPSVQSIPCRLLVTTPPSPHPTLGSWYM